jgi:hypothetical protein
MDYLDANQDGMGPDGDQFVITLKKFMSSFLRSQRGPVGGIEVELKSVFDRCSLLPHNYHVLIPYIDKQRKKSTCSMQSLRQLQTVI